MNALTTPNKSLFISYSRRQAGWTDKLYTAIDIHTNYQRWRDNKTPESSDWWESICLNIEGCYAFVAILTPDYMNSIYCIGELEYALRLNKPVIALVLQDSAYPKQLNAQRLQFARVMDLEIRDVIITVQRACDSIKDGYIQDRFSLDIHPRPHLRPNVPTPSQGTSEEDKVIAKKITDVQSGTITLPVKMKAAIIQAVNALEKGDYQLAIDLIKPLRGKANKRDQEIIKEIVIQARIAIEYDKIAELVKSNLTHKLGCQQYVQFKQEYPNHSDKLNLSDLCQGLLAPSDNSNPEQKPSVLEDAPTERIQAVKPTPLKSELDSARSFAGTNNSDWRPIIIQLGKIIPNTPLAEMEMCLVPVGQFQMGSNKNFDIEKPEHRQVITKPYWIARYPVTNIQWQKAVEAGSVHEPQVENALEWYKDPMMQNAPVVAVTWYESIQFAQWAGCQLPNEIAWEYAARGLDNLHYPWGNVWQEITPVWGRNSNGKPNLVTTKPDGASWVGAMHMSGNVWEWLLSQFETYPYVSQDGREESTANNNDLIVLRGGSWFGLNEDFFRTHDRLRDKPDSHDAGYGLRLSFSYQP
jgi:formylglycine-generating enzyme required for sulfatase activity